MATAQTTVDQFYHRLIDWYLQEERTNSHSQIGQLFFYKGLSIRQAIDNAVFGRYTVGDLQYFSTHYKYFPQHVGAQEKAREKLLKIQSALLKAKDFMELYSAVRTATQSVAPGKLSLLFFYDTTLRIGASEAVRLEPDKVFLQRGALWGAQATGISLADRTDERPYINVQVFYQLSNRFRDLKAMDIETLLCVKEREIARFMNFERPDELLEEAI
jgi:hypothetical protein